MHGVNVRWLYEDLQRGVFHVQDCHTQRMAADVFTKHFVSKECWEHAIRLLGFRDKDFGDSVLPRLTATISLFGHTAQHESSSKSPAQNRCSRFLDVNSVATMSQVSRRARAVQVLRRYPAVPLRPVANAQPMAPKELTEEAKVGQVPPQLRGERSEGSNPHSERGQGTFQGRSVVTNSVAMERVAGVQHSQRNVPAPPPPPPPPPTYGQPSQTQAPPMRKMQNAAGRRAPTHMPLSSSTVRIHWSTATCLRTCQRHSSLRCLWPQACWSQSQH